jgi:hypothetical protein
MKRQGWTLLPDLTGSVDWFSRLALEIAPRTLAHCPEIEEIEAHTRVLERQDMIRANPRLVRKQEEWEYLMHAFPTDSSEKRLMPSIGRKSMTGPGNVYIASWQARLRHAAPSLQHYTH